ncbi:hypothetical protein GCM10010495_18030 [Kitasatospora herbaricolor]|uniref:hypothetical protein n=1 Tax=Kitasatospora herbaricolor TaxID=68217 RepID=UPI001749F2EA|nr:hypothetical protein [Kitasatospora herbaricolor]MDQ0308251.1 hypothetical protein [Kitasatospora herbaricolor]GGV06293.1 hypothetical protein GCM10010495_18030 [Kitasatospora herbaricolor]
MSERLVRTVDGTVPQGMRVVLDVMEHAPVEPPRPWLVRQAAGQLLDGEDVTWFAEPGRVVRLVALVCPCSCVELTVYESGMETSRFVARLE